MEVIHAVFVGSEFVHERVDGANDPVRFESDCFADLNGNRGVHVYAPDGERIFALRAVTGEIFADFQPFLFVMVFAVFVRDRVEQFFQRFVHGNHAVTIGLDGNAEIFDEQCGAVLYALAVQIVHEFLPRFRFFRIQLINGLRVPVGAVEEVGKDIRSVLLSYAVIAVLAFYGRHVIFVSRSVGVHVRCAVAQNIGRRRNVLFC